jgi:ATP-dependent RNA helicase RhlB
MVVYDEADELLIQKDNQKFFEEFQKHLKKIDKNPQHCMYSATFTDDVINLASKYVGSFVPFTIKKEALKLKGVQNYRIALTEQQKDSFVSELHEKLDKVMSMIFVNKKETALKLQARLKSVSNITSHVLIGGIEA